MKMKDFRSQEEIHRYQDEIHDNRFDNKPEYVLLTGRQFISETHDFNWLTSQIDNISDFSQRHRCRVLQGEIIALDRGIEFQFEAARAHRSDHFKSLQHSLKALQMTNCQVSKVTELGKLIGLLAR